jgi:excisionase family DNA binding protein
MEESLLKGGQVAEILHVSRSFAYLLMRRGDIPTVRIGNAVRVRPEDLERYIQERSFKNSSEFKVDDRDNQG